MKLWKAMSVLGFAAAAAMAHSARAADSAKITYAAFDTAVEVPGGKLLPPGEYAFKIVRETSSSEVVQIFLALQAGTLGTPSPFNANHPMTLSATVLAVTDYRSRPGRGTVSYWQSRGGGPRALRTVLFAMDPQPLVFVYPRARAAELAKAANQPVASMASDPSADVDAMVKMPVKAVTANGEDIEAGEVYGQPGDKPAERPETNAGCTYEAGEVVCAYGRGDVHD